MALNDFSALRADEVEKHVVGAALLDADALDMALGIAREGDFSSEAYRCLYGLLAQMRSERRPTDILTVSEAAKERGILDRIGGEAMLMEIASEVVSSASVESHARIVADRAMRRKIVQGLGLEIERAYDLTVPAKAILEETEASLFNLATFGETQVGLRPLREFLAEKAQEWAEIVNGTRKGILTGIEAIDGMTGGLQPAKYTILAARPGMGKSALVLQALKQANVPSAMFSLEMLGGEQAERMVSQAVDGLDSYALRDAQSLIRHGSIIQTTVAELSSYPIYICDNPTITPEKIYAECRRMKRKHGLEIVVIDYIQLIHGGKGQTREQEVSKISKFCRQMANELKVHIIAIASLSRECERRDDKRPIQSDLRESGSLESDADNVLFLYRDSVYNKKSADNEQVRNITEFIWRKQRGGKTGRKIQVFNGRRLSFLNPTKQVEEFYRAFISGTDGESFLAGAQMPRNGES